MSNKSFISVKSTIHVVNNPDKPEMLGKVVFKTTEEAPFELDEGVTYIITKWDSTLYLKGLKDNKFEIIDKYGLEEIIIGEEYLAIRPKY